MSRTAPLPAALDKLVQLLGRLPGVGERSATRMAFHLLGDGGTFAGELARSLDGAVSRLGLCPNCHPLAERADGELCTVCRDPERANGLLCVVETVQDLLAFERTGAFDGRYHVLHGVLSPLKGVGPAELRLDGLEARLEREGIREVVLACNTDVEGEATALYLARRLQPTGVPVTRLATGLPLGGELEYADPSTLGRAFEGRRPLE